MSDVTTPTVIKGGDIMAFVGGKSVGFATNHTLTINMATTETTSKDAGGKWQTLEAGIISWTVDCEALMSNNAAGVTYAELREMMFARTPVTLKMGDKAESTDSAPATGWTPATTGITTGSAFITALTQNMPNGENATFSVSFSGTGALTTSSAS